MYNYVDLPEERFEQPSLTKPDESLTVQQILLRNARGLSLSTKVPVYHGDDESIAGIDTRKLDIAERNQLYKDAQEAIKKYKGYIKQQEIEQGKAKDARIKELEQEIAKNQTSQDKDKGAQQPT